jgi:hypothetical protein
MAITTRDGALAGMQYPRDFVKAVTPTLVAGRPHSLFYLAGRPSAAAAPSPGIGGAQLTFYSGQIPFDDVATGSSYLGRFQANATQPGTLILADRLWHNSGITITTNTLQTFTASSTIPPRDVYGTSNGTGVYAAIEVSAATGAGTPTLTLTYTNQSGTSGRVATNILPTVATSAAGAFYEIGLQSGDTGIQRAESLTLSATWTSGTIHLVLYRVISRLELVGAFVPNAIDSLTSGFPQIFNDSVPFLIFQPNTTTATNVAGQVIWTQG